MTLRRNGSAEAREKLPWCLKYVNPEQFEEIRDTINLELSADTWIEYLDAAATAQWILDFTNHDKDLVAYYVGDKQIYFADPHAVWLTGPDGGFEHVWKCDHCESVYTDTDK